MEKHDQVVLRLDSERRLRDIQRAFRSLHAQWDWRTSFWRMLRQRVLYWGGPILIGVAAGATSLAFFDQSRKLGSAELAARHILSAPNCDAARAQGLAPARRGQAGYFRTHDRDNDGIACEPFGVD